MASYREDVIFSAESGVNGNFTLSASPTSYDYIRVCYGSPKLVGPNLGNFGPMCTITLPTSMSYANMYGMFFGGVSASALATPYRTVASYSATNTTAWKQVFNRYGPASTYSAVTNAAWTKVYTVIGIKSGEQGSFHKDLLYDIYRDGSGANITLKNHPSAYHRIGVVCGMEPSRNFRCGNLYQEYQYSMLNGGSSGYVIPYSKFVNTPLPTNNVYQVGIYANCNTKTWHRNYGASFGETGGGGSTSTVVAYITQVIGIDRK